MKQLAIITATPPGINPGMLACEATALSFVGRAGLLRDSTFFRVRHIDAAVKTPDARLHTETVAACDIGIEFATLEHAAQLRDMVPLFWGDFLHMLAYLRAAAGDGGLAPLMELLLLPTAPAVRRRAVSYGTSILFNSTADYADPAYGPAFASFFGDAFHVQMRDAISAAVVSGIRRRPENCFGIDPAQLLALAPYESAIVGDRVAAQEACRGDRAAVFFARGRHDWRRLEPFIGELTSALDVRVGWIPWGDSLSFPFLEHAPYRSTIPLLPADRPDANRLQSLLRTIRESRCVITDTYHLAVVSWALGIPAIIISGDYHDAELVSKATNVRVRHDKRKIILGQDGLLDFLIEPPLITSPDCWGGIIGRLRDAIGSATCGPDFRRRLAARAAASEAALLAALREARDA